MDIRFDEKTAVVDLQLQKVGLEIKIKRLEEDLHFPNGIQSRGHADQLSNKIILRKILEIERNNLDKINSVLAQRKLEFKRKESL